MTLSFTTNLFYLNSCKNIGYKTDDYKTMAGRLASVFLILISGLFLVSCGSSNKNSDPSPGLDISTIERPWIKESEFQQDQSLHATLKQTVILDLEPASAQNETQFIRNTFRITIQNTETLSFCIPAQEHHITALEVVSNQGIILLQVARGSECPAVKIEPGQYTLHINHDTATVGQSGQLAFFRRMNQPRVLNTTNQSLTLNNTQLTSSRRINLPLALNNGTLGSIESTSPAWDFFTLKGPSGKYVELSLMGIPLAAAAATADTVTQTSVLLTGNFGMLGSSSCTPGSLSLAPYSDTPFAGLALFPSNVNGNLIPDNVLVEIGISTNTTDITNSCANAQKNIYGACTASFTIDDLGSYAIKLQSTDNCVAQTGTTPVYLDEFGVLRVQPGSSKAATQFTVDYKGFLCGDGTCSSSDLNLQTGEVAVFSECNFKGPAIVFAANVNDFAVYKDAPTDSAAGFVYGIKDNQAASIMIGPNTLVELWTNPGGSSGNTVLGIPQNNACLSGTAVDGKVSQLKVVSPKQYIVDTGGCDNCNLTGIDLSNTDLSNKTFLNATFTGGNLNNSTFASSALKNANFSGNTTKLTDTVFTSAGLECTNFSATNLTSATFGSNAFTTDFSCRLNLNSTSLNYSTFSDKDWRYFDLTSSKMNNVPVVLSSATAPLDLSGAILSHVNWLAGKHLENINLGCYASQSGQTTVCPTPNGSSVCSSLRGTVLNKTRLKDACLQNSSMEGVFLTASNLDGADMSGAQLSAIIGGKVATLDGAFMRNVNLASADLTGTSAQNIDFYTVAGGTADATNLTAPGADFTGAYLAFADFSGSAANLQSTNWSSAMALGVDFSQADMSINTSGGVNSGTNTTFNGAYLQGALFDQTNLDAVNFTNTYWDVLGSGGHLNLLIPKQSLEFIGYWKDISLPECPPSVMYVSGNPPPMNVTDASNTCPDGGPGPCDTTWGDPIQNISLAFFKSALPPLFPQDATVAANLQCSTSFSDPNPEDFCWITTNNPTLCPEFESVSLKNSKLPTPNGGTSDCTANTEPWSISIGNYSLNWKSDGNLVINNGTSTQWSSETSGNTTICWQDDGNLVIYDVGVNGNPVFTTDTADDENGGNGGRLLTLFSDGLLEITNQSGFTLWSVGPFE